MNIFPHSNNYYWFRLVSSTNIPAWHEEHLKIVELPTLVLFDGWHSFFSDRVIPSRIAMAERVRAQLEEDILPHFVAAQRWYGSKGETIRRVVITDHAEWATADYKWLAMLSRIDGATCEPQTYFLPLALAWENGNLERLHTMTPTTVAKVRQQAQVGILGMHLLTGHFVVR